MLKCKFSTLMMTSIFTEIVFIMTTDEAVSHLKAILKKNES